MEENGREGDDSRADVTPTPTLPPRRGRDGPLTAAKLGRSPRTTENLCRATVTSKRAAALHSSIAFPARSSSLPLDEVVRHYLLEVLEKTGGNESQAARLLGITRKTLRERLERG